MKLVDKLAIAYAKETYAKAVEKYSDNNYSRHAAARFDATDFKNKIYHCSEHWAETLGVDEKEINALYCDKPTSYFANALKRLSEKGRLKYVGLYSHNRWTRGKPESRHYAYETDLRKTILAKRAADAKKANVKRGRKKGAKNKPRADITLGGVPFKTVYSPDGSEYAVVTLSTGTKLLKLKKYYGNHVLAGSYDFKEFKGYIDLPEEVADFITEAYRKRVPDRNSISGLYSDLRSYRSYVGSDIAGENSGYYYFGHYADLCPNKIGDESVSRTATRWGVPDNIETDLIGSVRKSAVYANGEFIGFAVYDPNERNTSGKPYSSKYYFLAFRNDNDTLKLSRNFDIGVSVPSRVWYGDNFRSKTLDMLVKKLAVAYAPKEEKEEN